MRILLTGASGFIGRKLTTALAQHGSLTPSNGLVLLDQIETPMLASTGFSVKTVLGDLNNPATLQSAFDDGIDVIFHLAAVVSAQAEADFDLGMRVNVDGTRHLLEACRAQAKPPVFVTTSSVAAFGGELPAVVSDNQAPTPRSTYGMTKVVCELLVNEYSRKGFVDGRVVRLPTIVIRPGKPNKAASSFASGILREPLNGEAANCPVGAHVPIWLMSPRRAIEALLKAAEISAGELGDDRIITLPGLASTPEAMVAALERAAGADVADLVTWEIEPHIETIVTSWPGAFEATRARRLGFKADADMDEIIRAYREDDLYPGGS